MHSIATYPTVFHYNTLYVLFNFLKRLTNHQEQTSSTTLLKSHKALYSQRRDIIERYRIELPFPGVEHILRYIQCLCSTSSYKSESKNFAVAGYRTKESISPMWMTCTRIGGVIIGSEWRIAMFLGFKEWKAQACANCKDRDRPQTDRVC